MYNSYNSTDVDVLINDKPIKKYFFQGRWFLEARDGQEFSIRIKNNNSDRKLAIPSVDSLNVIDGKVNSEAGYIIGSYSSYIIKGFRTSDNKVNAFKFSRKHQSYAAKSEETNGDTTNVGVIGIKIFHEYQEPQYTFNALWNSPNQNNHQYDWLSTPRPITFNCNTTKSRSLSSQGLGNTLKSYNAEPTYGCFNFAGTNSSGPGPQEKINFDLGTEFSKKEIEDKIKTVEFKKGTFEQQIDIFYASRQALLDMGVPLEKQSYVAFPSSFPTNYCKPPKN